MKRYDCLTLLAPQVSAEMLTVTSLASNAREWTYLWDRGPNFFGMNMGLCLPFALGLSLAFPERKVIALDSDGSLMLDTSSLVTVAEVNPSNLVVIVFDNGAFSAGRMGPTATSRAADLEQMARGAGIITARTIRSLEEFSSCMKESLEGSGLGLYVVKVEPGAEPVPTTYNRTDGRPMREIFVETLRRFPEYREREDMP